VVSEVSVLVGQGHRQPFALSDPVEHIQLFF
jgi:hypothetical protein